jgi:hypothetical protein
MMEVRDYARRDKVDIIYGTVRLIEQDRESFLAWARKPYACVIFNVHVEHSTSGLIKAGDVFRRLIDIGPQARGSYFPTYIPAYALRRWRAATCSCRSSSLAQIRPASSSRASGTVLREDVREELERDR